MKFGLLLVGALVASSGLMWRSSQRQQLPNETPNVVEASQAGIGQLVPISSINLLDGSTMELSDGITVIAMTSATCPISQKLTETTKRLAKTYEGKVRFVCVNPMSSESAKEVQSHAKHLGLPYAHDSRIAGTLGAKTTTEVFVLDRNRTLIYRGAIDDQYSIGAAKPVATSNFLDDAITAALVGREIPIKATEAPGCLLSLKTEVQELKPTYHNRISRIIQDNCLRCHNNDGVAPIKLETYAQVGDRARMIAAITKSRRMPPWSAAPESGPSKWANDASLSPDDLKAIADWAAAGAPEGNPKDAPTPRKWPKEWGIGKPDLVIQLPEAIPVKADGVMDYVYVRYDPKLTEDKWITASQILPTDRSVVHHVLVFPIPPGQEFASDNRGLAGFFAGYVPGNDTQIFPEGYAKKVPAGTRFEFQIHYTPNGKATKDQLRMGLKFAAKEPKREIRTAAVTTLMLSIPPHASNHKVVGRLPVMRDADLYSFLPHMHVRGKAYRYEVEYPDGKTELLLDIPKYDFNWQLEYKLKNPKFIPRGSRIIGTAWYDNSDDNPANPDPSRRVTWGEQTSDEMMLGYMMFSPR
ncbi:MAG: hypothetical protein JNK63_02840 [Chthonomonas sp.]|nr:hypothetical protein [Chthonomonas sp.]